MTATRSHGSDTTAESYATGTGPGAAAAGGTPTAAAGPAATRCPSTATAGMEKHFRHQQLNIRVFDNIEPLSGGEDYQWQHWSRKIKTAVSRMSGEVAEILDAAEADGVRNLEEISKEDAFVGARHEDASRREESCTVCWRGTTSSDASTVVRSVMGLEGADSRKTLRIICRAQRECMYPKPAKDVSPGEIGDRAVGGEVESHDV